MEGRKIKKKTFDFNSFSIEDEEMVSDFLSHIDLERKQHIRKIKNQMLISIIVIYPIFLYFYILIEEFFYQDIFLLALSGWIILIIMILVFYIFFRTNAKMSNSLLIFIQKELEKMNLKLERDTKYIFYFIIHNSISILIMTCIFTIKLIFPPIIFDLITILLIFNLLFPLLWGNKKDKYIIRLKEKYIIQLNFRGKKLLIDKKKIPTIGIYMISNHLCTKWSKRKKFILDEISRARWLPRKSRPQVIPLTIYTYLYEYATILNFERRFLNLALGLKDWDCREK